MKLLTKTLLAILISFNAYAVDETILDIPLTDLNGNAVNLNTYNVPFRKGILLNIWATWCKPCVAELPSLLQSQLYLKELTVITVSSDRHGKIVKNFLKRYNIPQASSIFLLDKSGNQFKKLGITQVPTTLLINNEGKVVHKFDGAREWTNDLVLAEIKSKLKGN